MIKEYTVTDITGLDQVSNDLGKLMNSYRIFLLTGDLGAGKTTLVKAWMESLECADLVSSPTFSIINEYRISDQPVYHMDLYRIEDKNEVIEIGIDEYLDTSSGWCIIEWPEIYLDDINDDYVRINIQSISGQRIITIEEVRTH